MSIDRGRTSTLDVQLKTSNQRYASLSLFGGAGLATLLGTVLALGATHEQTVALSVQKSADERNITRGELDKYNNARVARDTLASASAASFGVASLLVLGAGALYYFDLPSAPRSAPEDRLGIRRGKVGLLPGGAFVSFEGAF